MAHVLLRLWKISEFLESWLVIAKSVAIGVRTVSNLVYSIKATKSAKIGVHTTSNQLNGMNATKIGYNRRTYNQQPTIGHKCNKNRLQSAYIRLITECTT